MLHNLSSFGSPAIELLKGKLFVWGFEGCHKSRGHSPFCMVSMVSIPLPGRSRVRIVVGTNFIFSLDLSDDFWGTPSPLLRDNGVLSPD
jgi:hypothetical protein